MSDDATWSERFGEFVGAPTGDRYRALQDSVASHPGFVPGPSALTRLFAAAQERRDADVLALVTHSPPVLMLSPLAHFTAADSAARLGNTIHAAMEQVAGRACMKGLLATGDGSEAFPYRVLYRAEVVAALIALGTDVRSERSVRRGDVLFQVVQCLDEVERWFDVSATVTPGDARATAPAQKGDGARAHHYHFAQTYWAQFVFQKTTMLRDAAGDNAELSTMAQTMWRAVGRHLDGADVMPIDGLQAFGIGADGLRPCVLVKMPPVERPPEAYLIAVFFDAEPKPETTRYYLLEKSVGAAAFVCSVGADGKHRSHKALAEVDSDAFFDVVFALEEAGTAPG